MSINLKPLGSRIVVEPLEQEDKTASGLFLPETAKEKPQQGTSFSPSAPATVMTAATALPWMWQ